MKPTVISNANATATAGSGPNGNANGMNIPINREFVSGSGGGGVGSPHQQHTQQQHPQYAQYASDGSYGSPNTRARQYQQQPPQQQQTPAHFQQGFGFEPDMDIDMDMFPRSRFGRMHHDPFASFGGTHFGFPEFGTMGRRRATGAGAGTDDDFFNRLPSEFRQYIPETFAQRRTGSGSSHIPPQQHYQQPSHPPHPDQYFAQPGQTQPPPPPNSDARMPQSPSKRLCDAAIQTEDNAGRSEVDHAAPMPPQHIDNLNQHGLRNTMDMGIKSAPENEMSGIRSHSAPPPAQLQQHQQHMHQQHQPQQQMPVNGKRQTPPPNMQQQQYGTQNSPQVQANYGGQPPQFQKAYYAPQQQTHPQQKQQTPPPQQQQQQPQTPGGSYIRTIPIFVEGRSEPIINSHKEIPNQNVATASANNNSANASASATANARAFTPQQQHAYAQQQPQQQQQQHQPQQQQRPTPLNTQQQPQQQAAQGGLPPQTPHTLDSINKIQDIQRDVLALMAKVEKFTGMRKDKEYVYLDEMLTRNLLKLDTIDTQGKESIRLARKEAIKCIQASINVLEAKAEENAKLTQPAGTDSDSAASAIAVRKSNSKDGVETKDDQATAEQAPQTPQPVDASKIQEAIPLPPPPSAVEAAQASDNKGASGTQQSKEAQQHDEQQQQQQQKLQKQTSNTTIESSRTENDESK